jgi:hypothetical protein
MKILKVFILPLLIAIYLITSTGVIVNAHYCCGELKSLSLTTPKSCCGDKEKSKGCCHNEAKYFKVKDNQIQSEDLAFFTPIVAVIEPVNWSSMFTVETFEIKLENEKIYDPPPLNSKTPIFIKNSVLII